MSQKSVIFVYYSSILRILLYKLYYGRKKEKEITPFA